MTAPLVWRGGVRVGLWGGARPLEGGSWYEEVEVVVGDRPSAGCRLSRGLSAAGLGSADQLKESICGEGQDGEHEVSHDLGGASDAHHACSEVVLEPAIATFCSGTFIVAKGFGAVERVWAFPPVPPVAIDDGDVAQAQAVLPDELAVVGGVHQVVEAHDPFSGHLCEGYRHLAVVY